jgi:hypothetical protein
MKKILALVLIMALMAAAAGSACAETLEFEAGTPSGVTPEEFKMYFTILEENSGYNFIWEDDIGTDNAYSVYKGASEDGMMTMNIYAADGGVVYAEGVGNLVIDINDADSAVKFGEWFGASISGMAFSFQIGDHGTESLDDDTLSKFNDDLMKLVNEISEGIADVKRLSDGFAVSSPVLSYPIGLEAQGGVNGSTANITMRILAFSADGKLTVR